jgi:NADPH-dependent curcumin reductase CurA
MVLRRARMEGFIVSDYLERFPEAIDKLTAWVAERKIRNREDIQRGIENAPRTLLRLFGGENAGKQLLQLDEPPISISRPAQ